MAHPAHARLWLRQIDGAAAALARVADDELRRLDDQTALDLSEALLSAVPAVVDPSRVSWSGLVEQQRLFARARR